MKKKALAFAIYLACASPSIISTEAFSADSFGGLNLGEVKSKSSLGEPFKGIIPIYSTSRKASKKLHVRLAPQSIFTKVGAERTVELEQLNFRISTSRGKPVIVVSSDYPMQLPILNFILEIESPSGVIYQDYTIMLDPKSKVSTKSRSKKKTKYRKSASKSYFSAKISKRPKIKYRVRSGDTLAKIAKRYKLKKVSLSKMIKGIYAANPKAFVKSDINRIKKGAVLRIPRAKKIRKLNSAKAKAKIKKRLTKSKTKSSKKLASKINTYKVKRGDTLSKITKKFASKGMSFTKLMRTIYKKNPHAFSKNKINLLKAGARLKIPTYTEVVKKKQQQIAVNTKPKTKLKTNDLVRNNKSTAIQKPAITTADLEIGNTTVAPPSTTIIYLQKRIRELRTELTSVKSNLDDMKEVSSDKITTPKLSLQELVAASLGESISLEDQIKMESLVRVDKSIPPKSINPILDILGMDNQEDIINKLTSNNNLAYIILALLLGAGLLKYRKKVYSYTKVPQDSPKFYPSDILDSKHLLEEEKPYSFDVALDEIPDEPFQIPSIKKVQKKPVEPRISPEKIASTETANDSGISTQYLQECDSLIDELILDLSNKPVRNDILKIDTNENTENNGILDLNIDTQPASELDMINDLDLNKHDINTKSEEESQLDPAIIEILNDLEGGSSLLTREKGSTV